MNIDPFKTTHSVTYGIDAVYGHFPEHLPMESFAKLTAKPWGTNTAGKGFGICCENNECDDCAGIPPCGNPVHPSVSPFHLKVPLTDGIKILEPDVDVKAAVKAHAEAFGAKVVFHVYKIESGTWDKKPAAGKYVVIPTAASPVP